MTTDSYIVTQILPPDGYRLGTQVSQTILVGPTGQTYNLDFTNIPYSGLIIQKLDGYNNDPLAGARFRVNHMDGTLVGEFITDHNGIIEIPDLLGWYTIQQLDVPAGFEFDPQPTRNVQIHAHTPTISTFVSPRQGSLEITLADDNGSPLAGGSFEVRRQNGQLVGEFVTNVSGGISIPTLGSGWYTVEQTSPPSGFVMTDTTLSVEVQTNTVARSQFVNIPLPSLVIEKVDTEGNPLSGAEFEVRTLTGELVHRGVTNQGGLITIPYLEPRTYEVIETKAPDGFVIAEPSRVIEITAGKTTVERFVNPRLSSFVIEKVDTEGNPLAGAEFEVRTLTGELVHRGVTNQGGLITIPNLELRTYEVIETKAPDGFVIVEPSRVVEITANETIVERFVNHRLSSFVIEKVDTEGNPLAGAEFEVRTLTGELVHRGVTNQGGLITIPNLEPRTYEVIETKAPDGFVIVEPSRVVEITANETIVERFVNPRLSSFVIEKVDTEGNPLAGAEFEVRTLTGELIHSGVTNQGGLITIPYLEPRTYEVIETRAPDGFVIVEPSRVIEVTAGETIVERFVNPRLSTFVIHKVDGDTNESLAGVAFEISTLAGRKVQNPINNSFEFVTDFAGMIHLPQVEDGTYVITETRPLQGYIGIEPIIFTIGQDNEYVLTVRNYRQGELTIRKVNSITKAPLQGVHFEISRPDGTKLINPSTGFHDFVTDRNGLIYLPVIEDGRYYLTETRALPNFIVDQEVIPFNIDTQSRQREHVLTVENTPASGLLIIKTDAQTGNPLEGVEFEVRHSDGRLVTNQILDGNQPNTPANSPQLASNGLFLTDRNGRINLNHLDTGIYHIRETRPLQGYEQDTTVHVVTVIAGQQTVLEVENTPLAGLRLFKTDSVTGQGIYNVEFMLFDSNNNVVGVFYTNNNGIIDFPSTLQAGRYTLRETRPAQGYAPDYVPRTIDFVPGKVTEIHWENTPMGGQLQISKVSGEWNEQNSLPAGTPLQGAIFEIYDERTGNLVDRIISDERGLAISSPLPLGRYVAIEVQAPQFYMVNPTPIPFEVEFDLQIVRATFPNFPANTGVTIRKVGPQEVMQGHNITYDIPTLRNDSTIPLADFYVRDILPTTAVRADKLVTGTYNVSLRYKVLGKTNKGNEIVIADNLSTLQNNVIKLKPAHLGLAADEFLVEFSLHFGQVPAGFTAVEKPKIYVDVLPRSMDNLPNGMMFVNKIDIGGRIPGTDEWVIGNSTAGSTVYNPNIITNIPQSGW